jgi:hypothetical protein
MKWITRQNLKVDRVACPWLIQRFIDGQAQFLFVDEGELLRVTAPWASTSVERLISRQRSASAARVAWA